MVSNFISILEYEKLNLKNKTIVFTNGCYDILHAGHIDFFEKAKNYGDILLVAVNSDRSIKQIKGESRPIINQINRIKMLSAIKYIDYIMIFDEPTPLELIKIIKPHVLLKGADWKNKGGIIGQDFVTSIGGRVEYIDLYQGLSTSIIIDRIISGQSK